MFVGLLVVVFSYGHSKQTRSLLLLDLYYSAWRAICDSYHGFYPRPENLFHLTDGRSEDVVPANTLKRLVRKRKYKKYIFIKIVYRGRIRTPTDEEKYNHNSDALSTELLLQMDNSLRFNLLKINKLRYLTLT